MNFIFNFLLYKTPFFYLIQSIWRDEAFSFFMARPSLSQVILKTANDFNPPLYYLLLHFWIYIVGQNDINLRMLSFAFHVAGVYFVYLLGRKISGRTGALFLAAFYFLNPMLLYYAFEMRMYSLYAMLTMVTVYYFYIKNWKRYTIAAALGLYTHSFFIMVIFSLAFYNFIHRVLRKNIFKTLIPVVFFLPWIPVLLIQFVKSKESWLFPVDFQLIKSSLGNLFTSYEGTPGHLWGYTAILSLFIIIFLFRSFNNKKAKGEIFVYPVIIPLFLILAYSVIKRPLYVNRYLIFITVFEILAIFCGLLSIKKNNVRRLVSISWIIFIFLFNIYISQYKKKTDFKSTITEINRVAKDKDQVFAKTPIGFLETAFYFKDEKRVYVYNPDNIHIPNYIGVNVVFPDVSKSILPLYPAKVFLINDDASYEILIEKQ